MGWIFPRLLGALLSVLLVGMLGRLVGDLLHWPVLGALTGAMLGALAYSLIDALRGQRFMKWLRLPDGNPAPRDAGFWGEVGYCVERSMRTLERQVVTEQTRLDQFLSAIEASPNGVMRLD